ncbi:MAG TPA: PTS transporter subunit EIIC [Candidatus Bariatricus faecipullorum]|nr:PTS transporter subunit EIIC [Candidatus Bariatricus faecipullorum]
MKTNKFEATMDKMSGLIERYIAPPLVAMGNQRHFAAIRTALIRTIPLIIIGSLPLILTSLPVESWANAMAPYAEKLNVLYTMTMNFMVLYLAISLGAELARMYEELDSTIVSIVTVACYVITVAPVDMETNTLEVTGFSAKGMFTLFVVAIIVVEFMHFAYKHNIIIRLPKSVPSGISQSFASLLPMAILLVFFWVLRVVVGFDLNSLLNMIVSPLLAVSDTWYAAFICALLLQLLWFVGIHGGSFTVWGVMYPFLLTNIAENAEAVAAGSAMPHILTEPFIYSWTMIGGTGMTLSLIVLWLRSKSAHLREVSRLSLIPGIFCVNEPVMFGVPIVLNPLMFVPFVFLTSLLGTMYGYVLTSLGWISPAYVQIPWTTPPLLQPYLSTGGDWRNVVAQAILIVLMVIIWYPFAKVYERRCIAEEQAGEES